MVRCHDHSYCLTQGIISKSTYEPPSIFLICGGLSTQRVFDTLLDDSLSLAFGQRVRTLGIFLPCASGRGRSSSLQLVGNTTVKAISKVPADTVGGLAGSAVSLERRSRATGHGHNQRSTRHSFRQRSLSSGVL
eukprot:5915127-Amphidinium_carterae.1